MIFKYQPILIHPKNKLFAKKSQFLRPIIPITVDTKDGKFEYKVLIDSGADYCLFHGFIGEKMGLNVKKGKVLSFYGSGGKMQKSYFHEIEFEVGEIKLKSFIGFSYDIDSLDFGLLGQNGFFDKFIVEFNLNKEEISLLAI